MCTCMCVCVYVPCWAKSVPAWRRDEHTLSFFLNSGMSPSIAMYRRPLPRLAPFGELFSDMTSRISFPPSPRFWFPPWSMWSRLTILTNHGQETQCLLPSSLGTFTGIVWKSLGDWSEYQSWQHPCKIWGTTRVATWTIASRVGALNNGSLQCLRCVYQCQSLPSWSDGLPRFW